MAARSARPGPSSGAEDSNGGTDAPAAQDGEAATDSGKRWSDLQRRKEDLLLLAVMAAESLRDEAPRSTADKDRPPRRTRGGARLHGVVRAAMAQQEREKAASAREASARGRLVLRVLVSGQEVCSAVRSDEPAERLVKAQLRPNDPTLTFVLVSSGRELVHDCQRAIADATPWMHLSVRTNSAGGVMSDCLLARGEDEPDAATAAGIRFAPFYMDDRPAAVGAGLFKRGLHYPGHVTPSTVSLSCICDSAGCGKPFQLQSHHCPSEGIAYFYCSRGAHALAVPAELEGAPRALEEPNPEALAKLEARLPPCEACGGTFSHLNPLRCPHCSEPFVDFAGSRARRTGELYCNVVLGAKLQSWSGAPPEPRKSEARGCLRVLVSGVEAAVVGASEPVEKRFAAQLLADDPTVSFVLSDETALTHKVRSAIDAGTPWLHLSVRINAKGGVMSDCLVGASADEPAPAEAKGIRFAPFHLAEHKRELPRGAGLFARGLHYPGYVTPSSVSLACVCDCCAGPFRLQSYHSTNANLAYFYCSGGPHTLAVPAHLDGAPTFGSEPDPAALSALEERLPPCTACRGKFAYRNPFRCPHCAQPFIDFHADEGRRPAELYFNTVFGDALQHWGDAASRRGTRGRTAGSSMTNDSRQLDERPGGALCEGWVSKLSIGHGVSALLGKNWRRRYMVLTSRDDTNVWLHYYSDESRSPEKGKGAIRIAPSDTTRIAAGHHKAAAPLPTKEAFSFTLTFAGADGKVHGLVCAVSDERMRDQWVRCIDERIATSSKVKF